MSATEASSTSATGTAAPAESRKRIRTRSSRFFLSPAARMAFASAGTSASGWNFFSCTCRATDPPGLTIATPDRASYSTTQSE